MAVNSTHPDYDKMLLKQTRVRDALDGDRVKAAGATYLPKLSGQDGADYAAYAKRGLYYGATARTLQGVSGLVFRRETMTTLPTAASEDLITDVTLHKVPIERFAQQTFDEAFSLGRVGVFVSLPTTATPGARAYLTRYRAESIINWQVDDSGARPRLSRVVLKECVYIRDGADVYGLKKVDQWRDVYLDERGLLAVDVWRKASDVGAEAVSMGSEFVRVAAHEPRFRGIRLPMVPFVFINARSIGHEIEEPPLLPLADANLDHYRLMTDYRHGLHYTALPTPYAFGLTEDNQLKIGAGTAWTSSNSDVKVGMLEFTGAGLNALEKAIENSVGYMASLGARLIEAEKNAAETAETHRLRQGREQATVAGTVQTVNDGLSQALTMMLNMSGIPGEAAVECNTDLVDASLTPEEFRTLVEALQTGAMAYETFYHNLQRGEITRPGVSADEERAQIAANAGPPLPPMDDDEDE
jgi:hypothetical protein